MYDLHTHTYFSDGTASPTHLVEGAAAARLSLLGITDHDTTDGLREARHVAHRLGVPFICGTEIEATYDEKLHILGLGIDPNSPELCEMLDTQADRREERNERMLRMLEYAGYDIEKYYHRGYGCTTRTHIAMALVAGGYASSTGDAFRRFIGRDKPYYVHCDHPSMQETIDCIRSAGGVAVLAHPHKMRCDHRALFKSLKDCGLWGVEAYYADMPGEYTRYFKKLAEEFGLNITCGSDYHGRNRPEATLGCAWRDVPELAETYEVLRKLAI